MVRNVRDGLVRVDPAGAPAYRRNAARYTAALRALDRELRRRIATVPAARRKLVTDHDAFGYLADRYGIRVVGAVIPSLSTAAEPSARDVVRLVQTIRSEGVCTVFSESSVSPKLAREVASEAGASVDASLYGDTLGPAGSPGATYLGMMRWDAARMVRGFSARC
jgi:ABC-type Zn uptake system ZnuABC Zn-binding protein ZnuA